MTASNRVAALAVLALLLALYGALPFIATPTFPQALWTLGFSQSFANASMATIHAANIGAPQPAAIAFGLAGAWPAGLFIAAGLQPADAYAAMVALWLSVAFFGAYGLARLAGAAPALALGGAALWLTMPMVWAHADYSMLGLGFALLPFYFRCALPMLQSGTQAVLYPLACVVAVFMDGYSFVMFAAGASLLGAWLYWRIPERRRDLARRALPLHLASFGLAAGLYVLYVDAGSFPPMPLDAFRTWGLDLAFFAVPAEGQHWIPDALGWSAARSEERFFGDASIWRSTFALPLVLAALWAWWKVRGAALATGLLVALVLGFYLALGPSLKVHATHTPAEDGKTMSAAQALAPTGSAWLSTRVPGLRDMRSAYRWLALTVFSAWLLLMLWLATGTRAPLVAAALVGLLNLPHPAEKWATGRHNREMFLRLDAELLHDLGRFVRPGERIAFLPWGNDVLANYLASRLAAVSYNVGGDKNVARAHRDWPQTLRQMPMGAVEPGFPAQALLLLARGEADAVVLPYVDLFWAAHFWPSPLAHAARLRPAIAAIERSGLARVTERGLYALVRFEGGSGPAAEAAVLREICAPPICLRGERLAPESPPATLAAGQFRVRLYGSGRSGGAGRIEVLSEQPGFRHASIALVASAPGVPGGLLAEGYVNLHYRVEDFQLRLVPGEGDLLRVEGYEVLPRPRPAARAP